MATADQNTGLMAEAQELASEYTRLLQEWIQKRESAIGQIRIVAKDLKDAQHRVDIAKMVGGVVAVLSGVAVVVGTAMTGGLATQLIVAGVAGSVAGGATSAGADIAEKLISKSKLETAQKVLDTDAKLCDHIEAVKERLDSKNKTLSHSLNLTFEQVQGAVLMVAATGRAVGFQNAVQGLKLMTKSKGFAKMLSTSFGLESAIGKSIGETLADVSVKGAARIAGRVLAGVLLVWDMYSLVINSMALAKGSPSKASESLMKTADELEKQLRSVKDLLKRIRDETEDFQTKIREHFRKLLGEVSAQGYASDDDTQFIVNYLSTYSSNEWQAAFLSLNVNLNQFAFNIARVFRNIGQLIETELNKGRRNHLRIILIAHGRIDPRIHVPCQIYYPTQYIQSVTLHSPWGCAIDASVVFGIATNTLEPRNVQYSAPVMPRIPSTWNTLPRDSSMTPNVKFTPVLVGEGTHQALLQLDAILQTRSDGLVIPYFTGIGNDLLPFPEIPLWVCTIATAACAQLLNITVDLRIAACLSPEDASIVNTSNGYLPGLNQYCQVPMNMNPPAQMTNHLTIDQRIIVALNRISGNLFL